MKSNKIFSGIDNLPIGPAPKQITEGCLVLEGGAFRGIYSAGALDALMQEGINLRCVIGVSAGALNGLNYSSGQIGRSARLTLRFRHDNRYVGVPALRKNRGLIGFDFMFQEYEAAFPFDHERFRDPERRFVAVACNCETGRTEYFEKGRCTNILRASRASASMPYVSQMVEIDGYPYLDGGCSCKVPYQWALDEGYEKIVVLRTREEGFRKKLSERPSPAPMFYRRYPEFAEVLARSDEDYNKQCDELERLHNDGRLLMLCPSAPIEVSRLEPDVEKLGELYYLGYNDTIDALPGLKRYLGIE